jgi:hypothetical protein
LLYLKRGIGRKNSIPTILLTLHFYASMTIVWVIG